MFDQRSDALSAESLRNLPADCRVCRVRDDGNASASPRDWQGHRDPPGHSPRNGTSPGDVGSLGQHGEAGASRGVPSESDDESDNAN